MPADIVWKQGDTGPVFKETFTNPSGTRPNLEGATVTLTLRAFTAANPITLTGTLAIVGEGEVTYTPSAEDTAIATDYMATWLVVFPDGSRMTFPTVGYLWVRVEESLTTAGGQQLVGLPEIKDHLDLPANDRVHDSKLIRCIEAIGPMIENHTGPLLVKQYEEWFDGGNDIITLTHTPHFGYGTSPVLNLIGVSEYRGPIEYPLEIIGSPMAGSVYSVMLNAREGTITRRAAGGITISFYPGRGTIHAVYEAGQEQIPGNVKEAALEAVRINYRGAQPSGRGREASADAEDEQTGPHLGFYLPGRCIEMLAPTRRAPSIA